MFDIANVTDVVMTNDPFSPIESKVGEGMDIGTNAFTLRCGWTR